MLRAFLLVASFLMPAVASAQAEDRWFGQDKALHFGVSAAVAAGGYFGSGLLLEDTRARLFAGAGLALTLGVAKELNDLAGYGQPSWRDLAWDVAGTAAGLAVAWAVDVFIVRPLRGSGTPSNGVNRQPLRARSAPPGQLRAVGGGFVLRF